MSLIVSYINKFGIVLASDSNLTDDRGNAGFGQKVFPIPHLNAGLAYSGTYTINGQVADEWITNFINGSVFISSTIEDFTQELARTLTGELRENEFDHHTIIHIAGYLKHEFNSYVEHWHISNTGLKSDGEYSEPRRDFHYSNDFNSRTNHDNNNSLAAFDNDSQYHQLYINGFPPGRKSVMVLKHAVDNMLAAIWRQGEWKFRRPANLFETSIIVKLYFILIKELFKMSDHKALFIGGETQTHFIPAPQDLDKTFRE